MHIMLFDVKEISEYVAYKFDSIKYHERATGRTTNVLADAHKYLVEKYNDDDIVVICTHDLDLASVLGFRLRDICEANGLPQGEMRKRIKYCTPETLKRTTTGFHGRIFVDDHVGFTIDF